MAKVIFRPPRHATTKAGAITYGVRASSREDPAGSYVEEGTIEVGSFVEPYAELVPRTSRGSRGASHDLAVDNRGNVRLNATVDAADADRLLSFEVAPPSVVVEPGDAGFAKVKVSPTQRFWRGPSKTRPFQLQVTPEGYTPITLDGALLQEAILPPWFMRAMLALVDGAALPRSCSGFSCSDRPSNRPHRRPSRLPWRICAKTRTPRSAAVRPPDDGRGIR